MEFDSLTDMPAKTRSFSDTIRDTLSLHGETDYDATIAQIRGDVELRSGGAWALVFAILIASVGLNVNSTAVIIGAMLISPLMGPIVGAGVALGTSDFVLLRRSLRNLLLAAAIGLGASTVFFVISPLAEAQSELLARTRPTLYDVLIALFGGSAGIIAASRRANKSQVIPGVAIATALMPPLCTAGFGLAHGDPWFFLGAMQLFLINALFICLATLGFINLMRFPRVAAHDAVAATRSRAIIIVLTLALVLPSVYTGWNVVQETRFKGAARRFMTENVRSGTRSVVNVDLRYAPRDTSVIEATLIGERITPAQIESLTTRLVAYGLTRTKLLLRQPIGRQPSLDELRDLLVQRERPTRDGAATSELEQRVASLQAELLRQRATELPTRALFTELHAMNPDLTTLTLGRVATVQDTSTAAPTMVGAATTWRRQPRAADLARIGKFIALRLEVDSVVLSSTSVR